MDREEEDLLGKMKIPNNVLYGIQTLRGINNFAATNNKLKDYPSLIKAYALVKRCCAYANFKVGKLSERKYEIISNVCEELEQGIHFEKNFLLDMIQGGAGTSINMNMNEVIANRGLELMGKKYGEYKYLSPNDDVNLSQSTNDTYPTAFKFAIYQETKRLIFQLDAIIYSFEEQAKINKNVYKMGRTHLQDAVPMTFEDEFLSYMESMIELKNQLLNIRDNLLIINIGGTAIGTKICTLPDYQKFFIEKINEETKIKFTIANNLIYANSDTSVLVNYHNCLKLLALKLCKICLDLRLSSSGPRCGLNEINLVKMQPGSSIMPGKVNPVIPEFVQQICYKVIGNDTTVCLASENSVFQLNTFEPVMVYSIFESIDILYNAIYTLNYLCIKYITINEEKCKENIEKSIGIVTALLPYLDYKTCSDIAKEAYEKNKTIKEILINKNLNTYIPIINNSYN